MRALVALVALVCGARVSEGPQHLRLQEASEPPQSLEELSEDTGEDTGEGYGCAKGTLEAYSTSSYHADVCRVPGAHWECPTGCEMTSNKLQPYCYWAGTTTKCHRSTDPGTTTTTRGVKDLSGKINDAKTEIDDANDKLNTDKEEVAQELDNKFGGLGEIETKADGNMELATEETNAVSKAENATINAAENAKELASMLSENMKKYIKDQFDIKQDIGISTRAAMGNLKASADLVVLTDGATFDGMYDNVAAASGTKETKEKEEISKYDMLEKSTADRINRRQKVYADQSGRWAETAKASAAKAAKDLKKTKTYLSKTESDVGKMIGDSQKAINVIPQGDKVINTKELNKHVGDADKSVLKLVASSTKEVEDVYEDVLKNAERKYKDVGRFADKESGDVTKVFENLIKEDEKSTERLKQQAVNLQTGAGELEAQVDTMSADVKADSISFANQVSVSEQQQTAALKVVSENLMRGATARVPEGQGEIDATSASLSSLIGDATTKLAASIAAQTDQIDGTVQSATMASSGMEADMESSVNEQKNLVASLQSTSSTTSATIAAASKEAIGMQKGLKDAADTAKFSMLLAKSKLEQEMKMAPKAFSVASNGKIQKLEIDIAAELPKIEQPIWSELDSTLREVGDLLATEKGVQNGQLGALTNQLSAVQETLLRYGGANQVTEVEIPQMKNAAETELSKLNDKLEQVNSDRARALEDLKKKAELGVIHVKNEMNAKIDEMRNGVRDTLGERSKLFFEQINRLSTMIKNVESNNGANLDELNTSHEYASEKLADLEKALVALTARINSQVTGMEGQVQELKGPKLHELVKIGEESTRDAEQYIARYQQEVKVKTELAVSEAEKALNVDLQSHAGAAQARIEQQGTSIRTLVSSSVDRVQSELDKLKSKSEDLTLSAQQTTAKAKSAADDATRDTALFSADATRLGEEADKRMAAAQVQATALQQTFAESTERAIGVASHHLAKEREQVKDGLTAALDAMRAREGDGAADALLKKALKTVDEQKEITAAVSNAAQVSIDNIDGRFTKAEVDLSSELDQTQRDEVSQEEGAADNVAEITDEMEGAVARNQAVVTALDQQTKDVQIERDQAADEISDAVNSQAKAIKAVDDAAFGGLSSQLSSAAHAELVNEEGITPAEKRLWEQSNKLDKNQQSYGETISTQTAAFQQQLEVEQKAVTDNVASLDKYGIFTRQQGMDLIRSAVDVLKHEASKSDDMFDQVEQEEYALDEKVREMMGGGEFQKLSKIMKTDQYLHKVAADDDDVVKALAAHEETSLPWMSKVLTELENAHDEKVKMEEGGAAADAAAKAKAEERSAATFKAMQGLVDSDGAALPGDQLSSLTSGANDMLNAVAIQQAAEDKEALGRLAGESEKTENGLDLETDEQINHLSGVKDSLESTKQVAASMSDDVQELLSYNEKVLAEEKARLDKRAESISDAFGGLPVSEHEDKTDSEAAPSSQLEAKAARKKKLAALLQQNEMLGKVNAALDKKHIDLTGKVEHQLEKNHIDYEHITA